MDCKTVLEKINAYLDGELPEDVLRSVEQHIALCSGCIGELQSIKAVNRVLVHAPEISVPQRFAKETVRKALLLKKSDLTLSEWWRIVTHLWRFAACATAMAGLLTGASVPQFLLFQVKSPGRVHQAFFNEDDASLAKTYLKLMHVSERVNTEEEIGA